MSSFYWEFKFNYSFIHHIYIDAGIFQWIYSNIKSESSFIISRMKSENTTFRLNQKVETHYIDFFSRNKPKTRRTSTLAKAL